MKDDKMILSDARPIIAEEEYTTFDNLSEKTLLIQKKKEKKSGILHSLHVLMAIILFFLCSTLSTVLIKLLNYKFKFNEFVFISLLRKSGFSLSFLMAGILYASSAKIREEAYWPSWRDLRNYFLIGAVDGMSNFFIVWGLNYITGSTYSILRMFEILFTIITSKILFGKKKVYSLFHYFAVFLILVSGALNAAVDFSREQASKNVEIGIFVTIFGTLLEPFVGVVSEKLLKQEQKRSRFELQIYTFWVIMFSFFVTLIPLIVSNEYKDWKKKFKQISVAGLLHPFIWICIGISVMRIIEYAMGFVIDVELSALSLSVIRVLRKGVFNVILFIIIFPKEEHFTWHRIVGLILIIIATICYTIGSYRIKYEIAYPILKGYLMF